MEERNMINILDLQNELKKAADLKNHIERVKVYRSVLVSAVKYIYQTKGKEVPEKASLLELIDSDIVSDFICDGDIVNSLHYVRILGMNAEHDKKIKKTEEKLALDNITYLVGLLASSEDGTRKEYQKPPYMS